MVKEFTYELAHLKTVSRDLIASFSSKVVVFKGAVGAGKTTLIKSLLKEMGSDDIVHSPSFSIVNEYATPSGKVYHFDLYRVEDPSELWDIGFEDYLTSGAWLFIEWPEIIIEVLPSNFNCIAISFEAEMSRSLKLTMKNKVLTENSAMTDI